MSAAPAVSVVVPAYQGARWILDAVRSALAQTFSDLEVVVVDDASSDDTAALAASTGDPRVRVVRNERNLGLAANWDRATSLARGEHVKWLLQDDVLYPRCVERLLEPMREHEDAAFAFCPRDLVLDDDAGDDERELADWIRDVHLALGPPPAYAPPGDLFARWSKAKCLGNVVGEPTCVLARRATIARAGLFHRRLVQLVDMEMWGRLAFFGGVAFVDEALCTFRIHRRSATRANVSSGRDALDRLWMLEGLLAVPEIREAHPEVVRWRRHELRRVLRRRLGRSAGPSSPPPAARLSAYGGYRLARLIGRAPALHHPLGDAAAS